MCCVCMTSSARVCWMVASLQVAQVFLKRKYLPGCASGVQPVQLCDSSPVMGCVSFANLCGFDFSEGGRQSVGKNGSDGEIKVAKGRNGFANSGTGETQQKSQEIMGGKEDVGAISLYPIFFYSLND